MNLTPSTPLPTGHLYTQPWSGTEYHLLHKLERHGYTHLAPIGGALLITRYADGVEGVEVLSAYALETIEQICKSREQWGERVILGEAGRHLGISTLSLAQAHDLHKTLGQARVGDTKRFATEVLGREVPSFTGLSHREARRLEKLAQNQPWAA